MLFTEGLILSLMFKNWDWEILVKYSLNYGVINVILQHLNHKPYRFLIRGTIWYVWDIDVQGQIALERTWFLAMCNLYVLFISWRITIWAPFLQTLLSFTCVVDIKYFVCVFFVMAVSYAKRIVFLSPEMSILTVYIHTL